MNNNERLLLLSCAAILIGRLPTPLSAEDKAFLSPLVGGNDWIALQQNMLDLVRSIGSEGG